MSLETVAPDTAPVATSKSRRTRRRQASTGALLLAHGEPMIWLTGGSLLLSLLMIVALLVLVIALGLGTFWPLPAIQVELHDGQVYMGELSKTERFPLTADAIQRDSAENRRAIVAALVASLEGQDVRPLVAEQLRQQQTNTTAEQEEVAGLHVTCQQQMDELQAAMPKPPPTPAGRVAAVRAASGVLAWEKLREELGTLDGRLQSLNAQLTASAEALELLTAKPEAEADLISELLVAPQPVTLEALLAVVAEAAGERQHKIRRRRLRVGNFELSGEHFKWINDVQVKPDGETRPEWAVVLERVEWGRFYGEPARFHQLCPRDVPANETSLKRAQAFFTQHGGLLDDGGQQALAGLLPRLESRLLEVRQQATTHSKQQLAETEGGQWQAVLESGDLVAPDQLPVDAVVRDFQQVWEGPANSWEQFEAHHEAVRARFQRRRHLEKHELGHTFRDQELARLAVRQSELDHGLVHIIPLLGVMESLHQEEIDLRQQRLDEVSVVAAIRTELADQPQLVAFAEQIDNRLAEEHAGQLADVATRIDEQQIVLGEAPQAVQQAMADYFETWRGAAKTAAELLAEIADLRQENEHYRLVVSTANGQEQEIALADIVRAYPANRLSWSERLNVYFSRWWEFLWDEPREANTEGGVFPAIWGTVIMTLVMALAVAPFGVLAALYLREYAKSGWIVSAVRIAINNLAGVPSIVFGVFGLGFFCYVIGATVDGGPSNAGFAPWESARWLTALAATAVVAVSAFVCSLFSLRQGPQSQPSMLRQCLGYASGVLWVAASACVVLLIVKTPHFGGFYAAQLPNPTFGKGGVLWASLTLALLTLPVVIVATEEALAAVPNSMREGSYGCGASKWQTIQRIVLPHALPGILTGMILSMARGAGEVAPLMLVGAVKLAPELPFDGIFPFLHGERSFMHLGFHIYDLGFQSPNSDAAKPMVYTTTLLLIGIITVLNLSAIWLRSFLSKRFQAQQF